MKVYNPQHPLTLIKRLYVQANYAFRFKDTYRQFTLPPANYAFTLEDTCHKFTQYYDRIQG